MFYVFYCFNELVLVGSFYKIYNENVNVFYFINNKFFIFDFDFLFVYYKSNIKLWFLFSIKCYE